MLLIVSTPRPTHISRVVSTLRNAAEYICKNTRGSETLGKSLHVDSTLIHRELKLFNYVPWREGSRGERSSKETSQLKDTRGLTVMGYTASSRLKVRHLYHPEMVNDDHVRVWTTHVVPHGPNKSIVRVMHRVGPPTNAVF